MESIHLTLADFSLGVSTFLAWLQNQFSNPTTQAQLTSPVNSIQHDILGAPSSATVVAYHTTTTLTLRPPWQWFPLISQDHPTDLAQAFNSLNVTDGADANWYMDTGATSHLASDTGILTYFSNKRHIKSILVGNGFSIPVTHTGHSKLFSINRPLHLHNILVTPNTIKKFICVHRFTNDNQVSIEFDPFGFTVKDLETPQVLLRCDSSGDLYPAPSSFHSFVALVSDSSSLWHQRLRHPGARVFNHLISL